MTTIKGILAEGWWPSHWKEEEVPTEDDYFADGFTKGAEAMLGVLRPLLSTIDEEYKAEIAWLTTGLEEIASAQLAECRKCKGSGWVWNKWKREGTKTCPRCGGQRKLVYSLDLMNIAKRTLERKVSDV